jgi:hypothetical protein
MKSMKQGLEAEGYNPCFLALQVEAVEAVELPLTFFCKLSEQLEMDRSFLCNVFQLQ